jgi:hypothetical protein
MCGYSVRTFKEGDEEEIVALFNGVYDGYGGFVLRTVDYWRWCCLERPDVKKDGIFLAFDGAKLCGYVVVGSSGNVWEFCVAESEKEASRLLLEEAVTYLGRVGASSANVYVPRDAGVVESLREAGFSAIPTERMYVTTLNPVALVQALVSSGKGGLFGGFNEEFGFRLHDAPYGVGTVFSVKITGETVEVSEGFPPEPSAVVELSFMDLLSVLFEGSSVGMLFFARKIRVKPFQKLIVVLKFLSAVRLNGSWFFPLSDYG